MKHTFLTIIALVCMTLISGSAAYAQKSSLKPHPSVNKKEMKSQYKKNRAQWDAMFRWLEEHDLQTIDAGKHPIEGSTLTVSVEDSHNDPLEKRGTESHRKHIDFQYVVRGTERFGLLDHASSTPKGEYDPSWDGIQYEYDKSKTRFVDSVPGEYFLFFPSDWHIAKVATDKEDQNIRVIVIKLDYIK